MSGRPTDREITILTGVAVLVMCSVAYFSQIDDVSIPEHPSFESELDAAMTLPVGYASSPAQDLRAKYHAAYERARKIKLAKIGYCEACGKKSHLECHHVISVERIFNEGLDPELIGDPANLIVLDREHHFEIGHLRNFSTSNPHVRRDAAAMLRKTTVAP